jgi:hypothetical protein
VKELGPTDTVGIAVGSVLGAKVGSELGITDTVGSMLGAIGVFVGKSEADGSKVNVVGLCDNVGIAVGSVIGNKLGAAVGIVEKVRSVLGLAAGREETPGVRVGCAVAFESVLGWKDGASFAIYLSEGGSLGIIEGIGLGSIEKDGTEAA